MRVGEMPIFVVFDMAARNDDLFILRFKYTRCQLLPPLVLYAKISVFNIDERLSLSKFLAMHKSNRSYR